MTTALQICQLQYDNALPDDNDAELAFYNYHATRLLCGEDARGVLWADFALAASEQVCGEDDNEFPLLQILLALRNAEPEKAAQLYLSHFDRVICECAERMVRHAKVTDDESD